MMADLVRQRREDVGQEGEQEVEGGRQQPSFPWPSDVYVHLHSVHFTSGPSHQREVYNSSSPHQLLYMIDALGFKR